MTKIFLSNNTSYELQENEHMTFGDMGVYVWDRPRSEVNGSEHYPPKRFYVYGFVEEVRVDEKI